MRNIDIDLVSASPFRHSSDRPVVTEKEVAVAQQHGVLEPVVARPVQDAGFEHYEIVLGEKSWLIAQRAGLSKVPVYIQHFTDDEARDIVKQLAGQFSNSFAEAQLDAKHSNPVTVAKAIQTMLKADPQLNAYSLAKRAGRSPSHYSNLRGLLKLAPEVQTLMRNGRLKFGHARPLIGLTKNDQIRLARQIISEKLSARKSERLARECRSKLPPAATSDPAARPSPLKDDNTNRMDNDTNRLQRAISEAIGCRTVINDGRLEIDFANNFEILQGVLERMGVHFE